MSGSRILHRIGNGTLYAVRTFREQRLPRLQFIDGDEVPGRSSKRYARASTRSRWKIGLPSEPRPVPRRGRGLAGLAAGSAALWWLSRGRNSSGEKAVGKSGEAPEPPGRGSRGSDLRPLFCPWSRSSPRFTFAAVPTRCTEARVIFGPLASAGFDHHPGPAAAHNGYGILYAATFIKTYVT